MIGQLLFRGRGVGGVRQTVKLISLLPGTEYYGRNGGKKQPEAAENNDEIVSKAAEDHIWSKAF